ncbi:MAG: glycosyltransferase family 2 protein [Candidatus Omnitrophota bacterium]
MKTCIIIPTLNEAKNIGQLVRQIRQQNLEVFVIDDGSSDNTEKIAKEHGARVIRNQQNEGKGASLIKGIEHALKENFHAVITMDGDGQHLVEDIPYFIRLAQYSNSSIIIGNRMHKPKNMPLTRLLTNKFMSWLISAIAKQYIPDTQCGFRLIKREVLEKMKLHARRYEIESEILIKGARLGYKIETVTIKSVYNGNKSQINPFIDTIRFIKFVMREIRNK